jgi:carboxymethylenebutenolidase
MTHPQDGAHAGVIVWPDILGLRPAFEQMGRRLAGQGYAVLVANPFYRSARAPVVAEGASFSDPEVSSTVFPMARALNAETHFTDARAFVDYLDSHGSVDTDRKIGTMGYCMGGPMIMRTAAARPDRIGAAASFHGGGLASDGADSPHLLIPDMPADFLIAIAENDDMSDPDAKVTLREAFDAAGLNAEIEVYEGAAHGWCPPDSTVYHEAQAERAWSRLLALFEGALA